MAWNNKKGSASTSNGKIKRGLNAKKAQKKAAKRAVKALFGKTLPLFMVLLVLLGVACALFYQQSATFRDFLHDYGIYTTTTTTTRVPTIDPNGDELAVHYIDVGQGDAALLQTAEGAVLIDCGSKEYGDDIIAYLESEGITELEYAIFTHPHEDHMGCAAAVLEGITVKNVIMNDRVSTANYFEEAVAVLEEKGINTILAVPGKIYTVGALQLRILAPYNPDFGSDDINNSSIVIHATYGERAFLFTGDAEKEAETELLENHGSELKSDVFSAGHHGSSTSNSQGILDACEPSYIIVSCGEGNSYHHPHDEAMTRFEGTGATIFRTDKVGTVVFVTDGVSLTVR